ncbi:MAG: GNAT family N-acetyltransferase [Zoogloeaceae bacterium]|nr:GNAT family N-acetyltransferase [Zoogloeaceae bacterium]
MRNRDVIELADLVRPGISVEIFEGAPPVLTLLPWRAARPLVLPLRLAVFVAEQGVPTEMEEDADDPLSLHVALRDPRGEVMATARLLPDGHLGRMAVRRGNRGQGIGRRVLEALISEARRRGFPRLVLHAQCRAVEFYRREGFAPEGEVFEEAGIAHQRMARSLLA